MFSFCDLLVGGFVIVDLCFVVCLLLCDVTGGFFCCLVGVLVDFEFDCWVYLLFCCLLVLCYFWVLILWCLVVYHLCSWFLLRFFYLPLCNAFWILLVCFCV